MTELLPTITGTSQNYYIDIYGSLASKRFFAGSIRQGEVKSCDGRG
jgi:hypothetical protein